MNNWKAVSILALLVVVSGCVKIETKDDQGTRAVSVDELTLSKHTVFDGGDFDASLEASNVGVLDAKVNPGEDGDRILTNHCPSIFDIKDYNERVPGAEQNEDSGIYTLEEGDKLYLDWVLQERDANSVPLPGENCNLDFVMPFNYSVNGYTQMQIKQGREIEGSELEQESSQGPMKIQFEPVGGTGEEGDGTFLAGDDENGQLRIRFANPEAEDYEKGIVDIYEPSLSIEFEGPGDLEFNESFEEVDYDQYCSGGGSNEALCLAIENKAYQWQAETGEPKCDLGRSEKLSMFEGTSRVIVCDFQIPGEEALENPSQLVEVRADVSYTYKKSLGGRSIEVVRRRR